MGIGFGAAGSRIARNANSPLTAASRRFTVAAANPSRAPPAGIASTLAAPPGVLASRQAARNRSRTSVSIWSEPPVLLGQPAQERQQVERVAPPRPGRIVAVAQIPQEVVDQPDVIAVRAGQHPAVVPSLDPQLDHRRHETCINQQTGQRGKHPAHHGVSPQHRQRLAGKGDTTSTYFELEDPDEPVARDDHGHPLPDNPATQDDGKDDGKDDGANRGGFRTHGKSKDSRDDLPQIVIGMAVTRDGIPVRVWCWPGNTNDSALIRQVKADMRDWTLSRIVWVADRGFSSETNRRYLRQGDHAYIIGEKLRSDSPEIKAALSRQGRYTEIADNMRVKEVKVPATERFVICHNPDAAQRDAYIRAQLVAQLDELIAGSDSLPAMKRGELRGKISTKPGLNRYLRVTPSGLLRIDKARCKTEANLDGKYLQRCSDPHLSATDIARGYKQLLEVERGWRDMKQILDLRPVYHRLEQRIRAHVVLCWLALLLIRIIETTTGDTWTTVRRHLDRLHAGTFTGPTGMFRQRTELSKPQQDLLARLDIPAPKQIIELTTASR